jgi:hypothetical protein
MLENKEPLKNMAKLKKKCLKLHGHGSVPTTGFRCHIGHVYNGRPCISHSARNISLHDDLWRMRWAVKGYDDPSVDYAGQMMQSLHALNASLLMLGDSLTRQLNSALFCELTRSTSVQLPWWLTATMDRVSRVYVGDDKHERYRSYQEWRQAVSRLGLEKADDLFSADTWRGSFGSRHVQMLYRELRTFGGYYQSHIMGDVSRLLKHHDAIVITVGLGLWYNDNKKAKPKTNVESSRTRSAYKGHLVDMLSLFEQIPSLYPGKKVVMVWMESSAQHWKDPSGDLVNGYYPHRPGSPPSENQCGPIASPRESDPTRADWRNTDFREVLGKQARFVSEDSMFAAAPIRALTEPLSDLHVALDHSDCTHYCWMPQFYQVIYARLARITAEAEQRWVTRE